MQFEDYAVVRPSSAGPFTTIQSAIAHAALFNPPKAVIIGSNYSGTDTYTNPSNISVIDLRSGTLNTGTTLPGSLTISGNLVGANVTGTIAAIQSLDVSTFAGADLGAKLLAAQASAPAAGCILDCRNFTSPQSLSTSVTIAGPHRILAAGLVVTQTAAISFTGNNSGIIGTQGRAFILNKGANIDQITISANDVVIDNITLDGKLGSSFTGNGITISSGKLRPIISNSTITNQFTDAIHDSGSSDLMLFSSLISAYGVNGYRATSSSTVYARLIGTTITDSASSTGSNILSAGVLFVTETRLLTASNNPSISNSGTITVSNSYISNTAGNSCYFHTSGTSTITSSTLSGGGTVSATTRAAVDASTGTLILTNNTITGLGVGYAVHADGMQNGNCIIAHNEMTQVFSSQGFAILYLSGNSIGMLVHDNSLIFNDSSPSGNNYGMYLQCPSGLHFILHRIENNQFRATGTGPDIAMYLDNTTNNGVSSGHIIRGNVFTDMQGGGILRNDPDNFMTVLFEENTSNGGGGAVYLTPTAGGGQDVILHTISSLTVATLPVCGLGSRIRLLDGLPTSPVRAGAGEFPEGTIATKTSNGWTSMTSPVCGQVNLTGQTAIIGLNAFNGGAFFAAGEYLLTWNCKVTTAGSVSSTLGPLTVVYIDPDGVTVTLTCAAVLAAGTLATSSTANTTGTVLIGVPMLLNLEANTRLNYAFTYASNAAASMNYNLNICLEIR